MHKQFKKNKIAIITYAIVIILIALGISQYKNEYGYDKKIEANEMFIATCYKQTTVDPNFDINICKEAEQKEIKKDDT